jgi:anaerobic magnesium-protoporphyrin IX monomethyl ester cyclase
MKVLLTAPDVPFVGVNRRMPAEALYLLAAVARANGHEVAVMDHSAHELAPVEAVPFSSTRLPFEQSRFLSRVEIEALDRRADQLQYPRLLAEAARADAVGISVNTLNWVYARTMIRALKANEPRRPVIVGGPHATHLPDDVLQASDADYVVRGEGEHTFPALLDCLQRGRDPGHVLGLSYRSRNSVVHTRAAPLLSPEELDALPLPAYDLLPVGQFATLGVETSRGCRHHCRFCAIPFRGSWRPVSPETVLRRIRHVHMHAQALRPGPNGKKEILFLDDNLTEDASRAVAIFDGITRIGSAAFEYSMEGRVDDMLEPCNVEALAAVPLRRWLVGVESGSNVGLRKVGKRLTVEQVERCASIAAQAGLARIAKFSFILGLPWEHVSDGLRTIDFATSLVIRHGVAAQLCWHGLFPGSQIWGSRARLGIRVGPESYHSHAFQSWDAFLDMCPGMTASDIVALWDRLSVAAAVAEVIRGPGRISLPLRHFAEPMERRCESC